MTAKKVDKLAMKQVRRKRSGTVSVTSKWSLIVTVYLLFNRFHWSKKKVQHFLDHYSERSGDIAPDRERLIAAEDRTNPYSLTFDEIKESNDLDLKMKNSIEAMEQGKIEKRIAFYQDHVIDWILAVIEDTLQSDSGWWGEDKKKTCMRFAEMYDQQIRKLKNEEQIIKMLDAIKNDYGFDLEISVK